MSNVKSAKPLLTPKGTFAFPKLTEPDNFKNKLTYNTGLVVDPDAPGVAAFIQRLEAIRDAEIESVKAKLIAEGKAGAAKKVKDRPVFQNEEDKDGNETGNIQFSAKMNAEYKCKKTGAMKPMKPNFYDSQGNPIAAPKSIWGGTVGKLGVKPVATLREADGAYGVTLYLDAVFIIDLKQGGQKDASYYGFAAEEGGYVGGARGDGYDMDDDDAGGGGAPAVDDDGDGDY